jgi:hypothetical protein
MALTNDKTRKEIHVESSPRFDGHRGPRRTVRKSQLSLQRQWLVGEMQDLCSGWIRHLAITDRQPSFSPAPKKSPRRRLNAPRRRHVAAPAGDFLLKEQVLNLFDYIEELGNGTIMIEVSDGLPVDVTIE